VPAERKIVTTGLYGHVRHPVYTGLFLVILGTLLVYFSWRNLVLTAVWMGLWVVKTFVEENFLRKNPEYAEYMAKVRWRWVPYVA
jgi:protein-S-isoprenylcysteine O-methyltransferase Ste14